MAIWYLHWNDEVVTGQGKPDTPFFPFQSFWKQLNAIVCLDYRVVSSCILVHLYYCDAVVALPLLTRLPRGVVHCQVFYLKLICVVRFARLHHNLSMKEYKVENCNFFVISRCMFIMKKK